MTQTITAQEKNLLEQHAQTSRLGLAIFRPQVLFQAQVHSTGAGSPGLLLQNVTGNIGDMERHFMIVAGSAPGQSDGGKVRFRFWPGGTTIMVNLNAIDWPSFPHITGLRVIDPYIILPNLGNDHEDDDVPYDGVSNRNYHPLARIGPPGWAQTGQTLQFFAAPQPIASGANITGHSWVFPGGTPATSNIQGTAVAPINVTWAAPTGQFPNYVRYTATDSNGRTHTRYNPVWIGDLRSFYCDLEIENLQIEWSQLFATLSLTVRDAGDADQWPQDAMICLFSEDYYGGTRQSIGGNWPYRENLLFCGYLISNSVQINHENSSVSFDAEGPMGIASRLLSWPKNLFDDGSPTQWAGLAGMTTGRAAFYFLTQRSTFHAIHDINYDNGVTLQSLDVPELDLSAQLNDYCLSADRAQKMVSDMQGNMYMTPEINLMATGDRNSIPQTVALEYKHMRDDPGLNLSLEDHNPTTSQIDFVGFGYDGQDARPWYSLAPGKQLPHGDVEKVDGIRVDSQDEANRVAGLYLADRNNIFRDNSVPLFNWRIFDIAPVQYATLTLTGSDNPRGIVWNQQRLIPRSITYSYDAENLRLEAEVTFEKDTFGPPGIPGHYPQAPPVVPPPDPPANNIAPDQLITWGLTEGTHIQAESWRNIDGDTSGADRLDLSGDIDPYWHLPEKAGTYFSALLIAFKTVTGKIFKTLNGGANWTDVSPGARYQTDVPNDWGISPTPTFANFNPSDFKASTGTNNLFAMSINYEPVTDVWITAIGITKVAAAPGALTWLWETVRRWWHGKDISDAVTLGAYQPLGSASQAAALVNLDSPGTNDATEAATIGWAANTGWDFSAGTGYITLPFDMPLDGTVSIFIRFSTVSSGSVIGIEQAGSNFGIAEAAGNLNLTKNALTHQLTSVASGTIALVRRTLPDLSQDEAFYLDGVQVFSSTTLQSFGQQLQLFVGAANSAAGVTNPLTSGTVQAVALYNVPLTDLQIRAISFHMSGLGIG